MLHLFPSCSTSLPCLGTHFPEYGRVDFLMWETNYWKMRNYCTKYVTLRTEIFVDWLDKTWKDLTSWRDAVYTALLSKKLSVSFMAECYTQGHIMELCNSLSLSVFLSPSLCLPLSPSPSSFLVLWSYFFLSFPVGMEMTKLFVLVYEVALFVCLFGLHTF